MILLEIIHQMSKLNIKKRKKELRFVNRELHIQQLLNHHTFANGARQLVVQLALETTSMLGVYVFSFTPITNIGASADGADITTFLAPPCREYENISQSAVQH